MKRHIISFLLMLLALNSFSQDRGIFTDDRDNQSYKWIHIGSQIWMAENLKYNARGSGYYDLNHYGRLYDWNMAKKVCPSGWHLPSAEEWDLLEEFVGADAGMKLKSKTGWKYYMQNGNGIDLVGFNALPGGHYQAYSKKFLYYGSGITFWTSTNYDSENAIVRELGSHFNNIMHSELYKVHGCYCRCIKD